MCTACSSSYLGGGLPQCMLGCASWVWATWRLPSRVWAYIPPGCGPGDPLPGQTPQVPPWVWAWKPAKHAGIPPVGYHPPVNRMRDTCKKHNLSPTSLCNSDGHVVINICQAPDLCANLNMTC